MGVHRLLSYIQEHEAALHTRLVVTADKARKHASSSSSGGSKASPSETMAAPTIVIDGYGFWISLAFAASALHSHGGSHPANDHHHRRAAFPTFHDAGLMGGDVATAVAAFGTCLTVLCEHIGARIIFAVDAPRGASGPVSARDAVWDARQKESQEATSAFYRYVSGSTSMKASSQRDFPPPALLFPALRGAIRSFADDFARRHPEASTAGPVCREIVLDGEVDDAIGKLVHDHNADIVISSDTDMLAVPLMKRRDDANPQLRQQDRQEDVYVVLTQEFPWHAVFEPEAKNVTMKALSRSRLASHLGLDAPIPALAGLGSPSTDGLLVAASICGNDITASKDGSTSVRATPAKGDMAFAAEIVLAGSGAATTATGKERVTGGEAATMLAAALREGTVLRSIAWYAASGSATGIVGDEADARGTKLVRSTASSSGDATGIRGANEFCDAYTDGRIPASALPVLLFDLIIRRLPPYTEACGCQLGDVHDRTTFQHLDATIRELMASQRNAFLSTPLQFDDALPPWFAVFHGPTSGKIALVNKTFGRVSTTERPTLHELVLWLANPLLYNEEVEMVSMMAAVAEYVWPVIRSDFRRSTDGDPQLSGSELRERAALLKELCPQDVLEERPCPRDLELAHIIATAFGSTVSFLSLIGYQPSGASVAPHQFFSATLLHCVSIVGVKPWQSTVPSSVLARARQMVDSAMKRIGGVCGMRGRRPASTRFSADWIGVLQRDELADALDAGTDARVETGGLKLPGSRKGAAAAPSAAAKALSSGAAAPTAPLPIEEHMPSILKAVRDRPVVCIQGETGCGKSSMIPLRLLQDAESRGEQINILVTQPRRVAATSLANRVASLLGEPVGRRVGYRVGGGQHFHCESRQTKVRFVTTGYLLEAFVNNSRLWQESTHILLDEVHERCLQSDMLSLVMKLRLRDWLQSNGFIHDSDDDDRGSDSDGDSIVEQRHRGIDDEHVPTKATFVQAQQTGGAGARGATSRAQQLPTGVKRVVIMSATIQADMFRDYFMPVALPLVPPHARRSTASVIPHLAVGARRCKVDELFLDEFLQKEVANPSAAAAAVPSAGAAAPAAAAVRMNAGYVTTTGGFTGTPGAVAKSEQKAPPPAPPAPQTVPLAELLPTDVRNTLAAYLKKLQSSKGKYPFSLRGESVRAVADVALACAAPGTCVLVFLPGLDEIENTLEAVSVVGNRLSRRGTDVALRVYVLHSIVEIEEQQKIVQDAAPDECKIVLATNIAETSLTIPDVRVVIDVGMARRVEYDEASKMRSLRCVWCSRSAAKQRSGRAGRVCDGSVIRMYTKGTFENQMAQFDPSDFMPLEYSVLQVRKCLSSYGDLQSLMQMLVEPPSMTAVQGALTNLVAWGAMTPGPEYAVLKLGEVALMMPCDVLMTRAILLGASMGCAAEVIVVAAGMMLQQPLLRKPLRVFYDTDNEFNEAIGKNVQAMYHFDRGWRSDAHIFLSVFEQTGHCSRGDLYNLRDRKRHFDALSMRQVATMGKYAAHLAGSLLRFNVALGSEDRARVEDIANQTGGDDDGGRAVGSKTQKARKRKQVLFPSLDPTTVESVLVHCVLAASAQLLLTAKVMSNAGYHAKLAANMKVATGADVCPGPAAERHCVVFEGLSSAVLNAGLPALVAAFSHLCGCRVQVLPVYPRASLIVSVEVSPTGVAAAPALAAEQPPQPPVKVTVLRRGGSASTAADDLKAKEAERAAAAAAAAAAAKAEQAGAAAAETEPAARRPEGQLLPQCPADRRAPPLQPSHPALHAMVMLPKVSPKQAVALPLRSADDEGEPLPTPTIAASMRKIHAYREDPSGDAGVKVETTSLERWSVLSGPPALRDGDPTISTPSCLMYGMTSMLYGARMSATVCCSVSFDYCQALPLYCALLKTLPSIVRSSAASGKPPYVTLGVAWANGSDPHVCHVPPLFERADESKHGKGKSNDALFAAPLHALVDVAVMLLLQHISCRPAEAGDLKARLRLLLQRCLQSESNVMPTRMLYDVLSAWKAQAAQFFAPADDAADVDDKDKKKAKGKKKEKKQKKQASGTSSGTFGPGVNRLEIPVVSLLADEDAEVDSSLEERSSRAALFPRLSAAPFSGKSGLQWLPQDKREVLRELDELAQAARTLLLSEEEAPAEGRARPANRGLKPSKNAAVENHTVKTRSTAAADNDPPMVTPSFHAPAAAAAAASDDGDTDATSVKTPRQIRLLLQEAANRVPNFQVDTMEDAALCVGQRALVAAPAWHSVDYDCNDTSIRWLRADIEAVVDRDDLQMAVRAVDDPLTATLPVCHVFVLHSAEFNEWRNSRRHHGGGGATSDGAWTRDTRIARDLATLLDTPPVPSSDPVVVMPSSVAQSSANKRAAATDGSRDYADDDAAGSSSEDDDGPPSAAAAGTKKTKKALSGRKVIIEEANRAGASALASTWKGWTDDDDQRRDVLMHVASAMASAAVQTDLGKDKHGKVKKRDPKFLAKTAIGAMRLAIDVHGKPAMAADPHERQLDQIVAMASAVDVHIAQTKCVSGNERRGLVAFAVSEAEKTIRKSVNKARKRAGLPLQPVMDARVAQEVVDRVMRA